MLDRIVRLLDLRILIEGHILMGSLMIQAKAEWREFEALDMRDKLKADVISPRGRKALKVHRTFRPPIRNLLPTE